MTPAQLKAAIDRLGDLDYATRTNAARVVRRTAASQAVPALLQAVAEHADGYVRYRALVLLTGFNDPRTIDAMRQSLASPNDRLRTVAYSFFEHDPDASLAQQFVEALDKEQGEFVRPALVRALAALASASAAGAGQASAPARQALLRDVGRGENFFRSSVIEALGDYKAAYAYDAIAAVAKADGPLQDDAALALGKLGEPRALEILAALQRTAPRPTQPAIAAAICLLAVNCDAHLGFLVETLKFSDKNAGFQELLRAAAAGLGALGVAGQQPAVDALFSIGIPAKDDSTRAPVALALATIALRRTPLMMTVLDRHADRDAAIAILAEGFDMLEEDLDKERFYAFARRTYWESPDGSPRRALMQTLIAKLDF
ncbi:MAG TPA: HEAT repeat domain-containing protein [Vicinamibacterales bacterium]|nr:HEAT repeat domain-containing protein [Vicinamibacterales bacterium]